MADSVLDRIALQRYINEVLEQYEGPIETLSEVFKRVLREQEIHTTPVDKGNVVSSTLQFDAVNWDVYDETNNIIRFDDFTIEAEYANSILDVVAEKELIRESGRLSESGILKLVRFTGEKAVDEQHVNHAVELSNLVLPSSLTANTNLSAMYLQQVPYARFSALFCAFRPLLYCADEMVTCYETIAAVRSDDGWSGGVACVARCKPDGGIRLTGNFHLIAMMELTALNDDALPKQDPYKCIVMTSMALLSIERIRTQNSNKKDDRLIETAIPFIIGKHTTAKLFVTRLVEGRQLVKVVVLGTDDNSVVVEFTAMAAVLVANICRICNWYERDFAAMNTNSTMKEGLGNLLNAIPTTQLSNNPGKRPAETETTNDTKKAKTTWTKASISNPKANEIATSKVASRFGQVFHVTHPWSRVLQVNLDQDVATMRLGEMQFYQQQSPFYFTGLLRDENHDSVPVFCKVWREGDAATDRIHIENEINLHRLANNGCVPTATVLENDIGLTAMDVGLDVATTASSSGQDTFHVLVTTKHREDPVDLKDLKPFALALVRAVMKLHSIGILHCDINPGNALWDALEQVVRLIDFGSAQMVSTARSYKTTQGYVAPEVLTGEVHSEQSEAYSVGKTVLAFMAAAVENEPAEGPCVMTDKLKTLAELLSLVPSNVAPDG